MRGIFRHLCRASDHGLDKVIFVFAGEAGQPLDLVQNDLFQEVQPDIVRLAALAIAGVVILTTEKLDVVVVLVEVEIEVAAALRAFQQAGEYAGLLRDRGLFRRVPFWSACTFSQVWRSMMASWTLRKIARFSSGFSIRFFIL